MRRTIRIIVVAAITVAAFAGTAPAGATECTPKGCTGGCKLGSVNVDPHTLTIDVQPIRCYS